MFQSMVTRIIHLRKCMHVRIQSPRVWMNIDNIKCWTSTVTYGLSTCDRIGSEIWTWFVLAEWQFGSVNYRPLLIITCRSISHVAHSIGFLSRWHSCLLSSPFWHLELWSLSACCAKQSRWQKGRACAVSVSLIWARARVLMRWWSCAYEGFRLAFWNTTSWSTTSLTIQSLFS